MPRSLKLMILDACVLIDFIEADPSILKLLNKHVGSLYIASTTVSEIRGIGDESELEDLGMSIIEPELDDLYDASKIVGQTSFEDNVCYLVAKRHAFYCVTNDKRLRTLCKKGKISTLWGLELLLWLVKAGGLGKDDAKSLVNLIHKNNPTHITKSIVQRFKTEL